MKNLNARIIDLTGEAGEVDDDITAGLDDMLSDLGFDDEE